MGDAPLAVCLHLEDRQIAPRRAPFSRCSFVFDSPSDFTSAAHVSEGTFTTDFVDGLDERENGRLGAIVGEPEVIDGLHSNDWLQTMVGHEHSVLREALP